MFGKVDMIETYQSPVRLFLRARLPILPLEAWLEGIVFVFGTIRSVIVSCAGITAFAMAGLGAALTTHMLCFIP